MGSLLDVAWLREQLEQRRPPWLRTVLGFVLTQSGQRKRQWVDLLSRELPDSRLTWQPPWPWWLLAFTDWPPALPLPWDSAASGYFDHMFLVLSPSFPRTGKGTQQRGD